MNEEFRSHAPAPLEPLPVNIPAAEVTTLSCGLRLITVSDDRHPLVSLRMAFESGDIYDPAGSVGVSSAVASLVNEGTEEYSSRELAEEIDRIGASLSAASASDHTIVKASALSKFTPDLLDLFAGLVLTPTFPEKELALYKQNTIEGLKYQRSQPDFLADEQVARVVFGQHPYSINSPNADDISALERQALEEFHGRFWAPNNGMLIAVGDFETADLVSQLEARFGGWERVPPVEMEFPGFPEREQRTLTIVDRPGSSQANIVLSNLALKRNDPDYFPVLVMNQVLGAGASSRLFMNLREEKGYTYGAYSRIYAKRFAGSFEATAEVRTAVTRDSLNEFFSELERIRSERVPQQELDDAKNFLAGVFPIRIETQGGLVSQIVSQRLYGLPDDYLETYRDNVRGVGADEVERVAAKYIHPDSIAIVIVGDAVEILKQASGFADEVAVFDTESTPKDVTTIIAAAEADDADVHGVWHLDVSAQGQQLPLKLELTQEGTTVTGSLESMLGQGIVRDASVSGAVLKGTIVAEMHGQEIELDFQATVTGEEMDGMISIPVMPEPLSFSGRKLRES